MKFLENLGVEIASNQELVEEDEIDEGGFV